MKVYDYESSERHCREGVAIERNPGQFFDTFWASGQDAHRLTAGEVATAVLLFDTDDFDELDGYGRAARPSEWEQYALKDRALITSQHGLQVRYFVRRGAVPDLETQIDNASREVGDAEYVLRRAQWGVDSAKKILADLEEGKNNDD